MKSEKVKVIRSFMENTKIDYTKLANYTGISPNKLKKFEIGQMDLNDIDISILSMRLKQGLY